MVFAVSIAATVIGLPNIYAVVSEVYNWWLVANRNGKGARQSGILLVPLIIGAFDMLFLRFLALRWIGFFGVALVAEHLLVGAILLRTRPRRL